MSFGEQMAQNFQAFVDGLSVFLVGVTMVFVALLLLILLITVVGKIVTNLEAKKQPSKKVEPQKVEPVVVESQHVEVKEEMDELELVAVITAAIAVSLGTTTDKLRVRSLRQVTRQR